MKTLLPDVGRWVMGRWAERGVRASFVLLLLVSAQSHGLWLSDTQAIMGTEVSVTAWHEDEPTLQRAVAAVMSEMGRIDRSFSPYKEDSELSRVNRLAAREKLSISEELTFLIDKSLYFSRLSEGAFDITFASVGRHYNYRKKMTPSQKQKQMLLPAVNFRHLQLDKHAKTLKFEHANVHIDLGGIAKGYAVDRAAKILHTYGVVHATVSAGGDSRVLGDKRGRPWIIGIKNPRQNTGDSDTVIRMPLENTAVSTSGDYERYFIQEETGERVHHILNPKTGNSANEVVSVTILGRDGADTDPLSTTVFVLGVEKGLALVNRLPGFDCVIIDRFGKAHYSADLMQPSER